MARRFATRISERPRSLLLPLGVPSRPSPGSDPRPVQIRPHSPCALFFSISDPSRSRGGGHPGPSWSHSGPECSSRIGPGRAETDFLATSENRGDSRESIRANRFAEIICPVQSIELMPGLQFYMHCTATWAQVATRKECLSSIVGPCRNNSSTLSSLVIVQEVWPLRLRGNDYWSATA